MSSYKTILLISKILSYDSNQEFLSKALQSNDTNYDALVKIASSHLILPTLYNRLKKKNLLIHIPQELQSFLLEITTMNQSRNIAILKQAKKIGDILKAHEINHVFLKGTALLAAENNDMLIERMIGDIDVLVSKEHLNNAFNLIKAANYTPVKQTFGNNYHEHKHLPRLIPKNDIAAIEIHRKLLIDKNDELLNSDSVLASKITTDSGINIPKALHLLKHSIYNHQINDRGFFYNTFNFRSTYDTLIIQRLNKTNINYKENKYFRKFLCLCSLLFHDFNYPSTTKCIAKQKWFIIKQKHHFIYNVAYKLKKVLFFYKVLFSKSKLFINNRNYRKDLIKDRNRILAIFIKKR